MLIASVSKLFKKENKNYLVRRGSFNGRTLDSYPTGKGSIPFLAKGQTLLIFSKTTLNVLTVDSRHKLCKGLKLVSSELGT